MTLLPPPGSPVDVLFISMPFGPLTLPSIGLGLLQASLHPSGYSSRSLYFTLPFAQRIGPASYLKIADGEPAVPDLVGEWIFSGALFDEAALDADGYVRDVLRGGMPAHQKEAPVAEAFIQRVLDARRQAPAFLDACFREVLAHAPRLVCFTSVFQQHVASLALARRLKQAASAPFILFGGANCEGPMGEELLWQFPFVDAVVSGEADDVFPALAARLLGGADAGQRRGGERTRIGGYEGMKPTLPRSPLSASRSPSMDALPFPDYDDFFEQWRHAALPGLTPGLLFETSRGCWWGEKHHCTFCGLNGSTMAFRSKTAARALDELLYLTRRHPGASVSVVDNILDMAYFRDFIPMLARHDLGLDLFYEVKANLKKEQVRLLRDAGITTIQPGIESLSTPLLRAMRKGVSTLQNVQLLKWCNEFGVEALWNVLWGFPGEPSEEYDHMAHLVPWLTHLQPPVRFIPVRLDRFSPYFEDAASFGFTDVAPYPSYAYVYPLEPAALANMAYYFTAISDHPPTYPARLADELTAWQAAHASSDLVAVDAGSKLLLFDTRPAARNLVTELTGLQRVLYEACDAIHSAPHLQRLATRYTGTETSLEETEQHLALFLERGLMLREGDRYLSLAVSTEADRLSPPVLARFLALLPATHAALSTAEA